MRIIYNFLIFFFFLSNIFSQDIDESVPFRIGVNNITPLKIDNSEFDQKWFDDRIESALSKTANLTKENNWTINFQVISNQDEIIASQQKKIEELEDCLANECAFELGRWLNAKYVLNREVQYTPPKLQKVGPVNESNKFGNYDIIIEIIDIEKNVLFGSEAKTIELNAFERRKLKADILSEEIYNFIIETFQNTFKDQPILLTQNTSTSIKKNSERSFNAPEIESNIIKNINHGERIDIKLEAKDVEDDKFQFIITKPPSNGNWNGEVGVPLEGSTLAYIPDKLFTGREVIEYIAKDTSGLNSPTGKITIRVTNTPPVAYNDSFEIKQGQRLRIKLNAYDNEDDRLVYNVYEPKNGEINKVRRTENEYYYEPDKNFTGYDQVIFDVTDSANATSNPGIVDINVKSDKKVVIAKKPEPVQKPIENNDNNGPNLTTLIGIVLLVVILAAAGGGSGGGGGSGTGTVDIGITGP